MYDNLRRDALRCDNDVAQFRDRDLLEGSGIRRSTRCFSRRMKSLKRILRRHRHEDKPPVVDNPAHNQADAAPEMSEPAAAAASKTTCTVYVVYYSLYGHVYDLAQAIKKGIDTVDGCEAVLYQVLSAQKTEPVDREARPRSQRRSPRRYWQRCTPLPRKILPSLRRPTCKTQTPLSSASPRGLTALSLSLWCQTRVSILGLV